MEIWKDIPGYEGRYQASNMGLVRSIDRWERVEEYTRADGRIREAHWWFCKGVVLSPSPPKKSVRYGQVNLYSDEGPRSFLVHRLVALTFIPIEQGRLEVNHKNGDRLDNRVENLEWASRKENAAHARDVLGKKYPGKAVEAKFADGTRRVFPNQRAAEVALVGGQTGAVSLALRDGRKALGAEWRRI